MRAVLLVSHGSRLVETKQEVVSLIQKLKRKTEVPVFKYAFLEIERPNIPRGIDLCVKKGATDVTILLNFLNTGRHVNHDIPRIVLAAQAKYPSVTFRITPPLGQHPKIVELFLELLKHSHRAV